ncbi:MAG: M20 family metallopeptidase [Flavobacteriales bacterium]|jgi:amidohydrolase|nr:M20 family metallopeptidase [Flavobacteriales bacterium]
MKEQLKFKIKALVDECSNDIIKIRHHLHQYPELSFKEYHTAKYIAKVLEDFGIEHQTGIVETGIVGEIKGKNPNKKVIALRADIDALPIQETSKVKFSSKNDGVMHACGHDFHTASLLGTLYILKQLKDSFEGTIKFLFQPGEELLPGGAKLMIAEGVLENPQVQSITGQHVYPDLETGTIGIKSGTYMASADEIYFTVKGKGGHGALPHLSIDPIVITSHIIVALQQIVSRNCSPYTPAVLSFGDIQGHGATNIIPNEVKVKGTFRTFDEEWREEAHGKMIKMAEGIADAMGATCEFEVRKGYPVLENDSELTDLNKKSAIEYLGEENVVELGLRMTAEDFAYYSHEVPACFYRIGTANQKKNIGGALHHGNLTIDDEALNVAMGLMAYLSIQQLAYK